MTTIRNRTAATLTCLAAATAMMIGAGTLNEATDAEPKAPAAQIGDPAPDFILTDLDGNEHTLSEYTAQGNIVVLEWFNPTCPFVKKHYRDDTMTMINLQTEFNAEDIVWLRINSAHEDHMTAGIELNKKAANDWNITTPILMDGQGTVGRSYGAKRTPEMYVIDASGTLVYHGAIDNRGDTQASGDVNFVHGALTDTLAGNECENASTKAYGCSVKYN